MGKCGSEYFLLKFMAALRIGQSILFFIDFLGINKKYHNDFNEIGNLFIELIQKTTVTKFLFHGH